MVLFHSDHCPTVFGIAQDPHHSDNISHDPAWITSFKVKSGAAATAGKSVPAPSKGQGQTNGQSKGSSRGDGLFGRGNSAQPVQGQPVNMLGRKAITPEQQQEQWMFKGKANPNYTPPPPAQAASAWADQAGMAAMKARAALADLKRIRADALQRVHTLGGRERQSLDQLNQMLRETRRELNSETGRIWNEYYATRMAVMQMLQKAVGAMGKNEQAAYSAVEGLRKAEIARSMAQMGMVSTPKEAVVAKASFALKTTDAGSPTVGTEPEAKVKEAIKSDDGIDSRLRTIARDELALIESTNETIVKRLADAQELVNKLTTKVADTESQMVTILKGAMDDASQASKVSSDALISATDAARTVEEMAKVAKYAQNAAGQAMAAQMAQAMGFNVMPQGVPSPFGPASIYVRGVPMHLLINPSPRLNSFL
jgi:hypothetical protein